MIGRIAILSITTARVSIKLIWVLVVWNMELIRIGENDLDKAKEAKWMNRELTSPRNCGLCFFCKKRDSMMESASHSPKKTKAGRYT